MPVGFTFAAFFSTVRVFLSLRLLFVVDFGQADGLYAPTSFAVAATVRNYNLEFCHEWSINVQDTLNGVPGVLYGRYPGDTYAAREAGTL